MLFRAEHVTDRRHKYKYGTLTGGELFCVSCCDSIETFLMLKICASAVRHHRRFSGINNNGRRTAFVFSRMHEVCV